MEHRSVWSISTDVSVERTASMFRLGRWEVARSFRESVNFYYSVRGIISEVRNFHSHPRENPKSHTYLVFPFDILQVQ
jgi:hypothetical protein